jgi:hypothetical protein
MPPLASAPTRWPHPSPPELGACSQRRLALARLGPGCRAGSSAQVGHSLEDLALCRVCRV